MSLGDKLVAAREKRGWNQNQAARVAGIGRTTLRQLENDEQDQQNLRLVTVASIIDAYDGDVGFTDFLDGFPLKNLKAIVVRPARRKR